METLGALFHSRDSFYIVESCTYKSHIFPCKVDYRPIDILPIGLMCIDPLPVFTMFRFADC